jgi:hypothetical protein
MVFLLLLSPRKIHFGRPPRVGVSRTRRLPKDQLRDAWHCSRASPLLLYLARLRLGVLHLRTTDTDPGPRGSPAGESRDSPHDAMATYMLLRSLVRFLRQ